MNQAAMTSLSDHENERTIFEFHLFSHPDYNDVSPHPPQATTLKGTTTTATTLW
jgi:hypothetical protein